MSLTPAERMMAARCRLMTREPWYGHMAMSMHWIESEMSWLPEEARTMGIKITGNNEIQCHYYPKWAENTPLERMYGAIEHVINHLVRLHTLRASGKNPMAWAIACFKGSEFVMGSIPKPIAELVEGDMVVGRNGLTRVVRTMHRPLDGQLVTIKAGYILPFSATPEHPILATRWRLHTTSNPKTTIKIYDEPEFVEASKLTGSDGQRGSPARDGWALVIPKLKLSHTEFLDLNPYITPSSQSRPINRAVALTENLAWILGLYVAEGSHGRENTTIQFSLGADEVDVAERLIGYMADMGYTGSYSINGSRLRVVFGSPVLARAFGDWFGRSSHTDWFGRSSHTKRIPIWLMQESSREIFASFLAGYLEGDGCVCGERNAGFTVSEGLAKQLQLMAFSHDIPFGISKTVRPPRQINDPERGIIELPEEIGYQIEANNWQANELFAQDTSRRRRSFCHQTADAIYIPILEIGKENFKGQVYNIETAEHTYTVSNVVVHNCDMAVNGRKNNARIGYREDNGALTLPFKDMIFIPDDWPENETAEYYYDRIVKESPDNGAPGEAQGGEGGGDGEGEDGESEGGAGQGQVKPGNGANQYKYGKFGGAAVDDHEIWSQSDISEDEARQLINERAKDASQKAQGHTPGHLKEALEKLNKPIIKWRDILRQFLGVHVGNRRKTYSRPDRRQGQFGTKGVSHHANCCVTVIVDSSGSISTKELEQFFTEVEAIAYRAKLSLIIWDAALQGVVAPYRKGDWKKIQIRGGGGTDMAAPVTWAEENGLITDVGIMLTDGVCNWPGPRPYPMIFCITTPAGTTAAPEWGTSIRMKLE